MTLRLRHAWIAVAPLVACNAILGTPDPFLRSEGGAGADGGVARPSVTGDCGAAMPCEGAVPPPKDAACTGDASDDPDNCGACGHSCQGGACANGICQPVLIAGDPARSTGLFSLYAMTVVNGALFGTNWYASAGLVYTVQPNAGIKFLVPSNPAFAGSPIATDGVDVYYGVFRAPDVGLWVMDVDGGGRHLLSSAPQIGPLAADDRYVYFMQAGLAGLHRLDKTGANEVVAPLPGATGGGIRVQNGQIYVTQTELKRIVMLDRESLGPVNVVVAPGDAGAPVNLDIDDGFVYWVDEFNHFWRHPRSPLGGDGVDITPSKLAPKPGFVVDDANVWAYGGGRIVRFAKDGSGEPLLVFTIPNNDLAFGFAQDATTLYFGTYGAGYQVAGEPYSAIYKLAK